MRGRGQHTYRAGHALPAADLIRRCTAELRAELRAAAAARAYRPRHAARERVVVHDHTGEFLEGGQR